MFSHDPEPANDIERQSEATLQIAEKTQCPENGMLQGLAATIAGLNREQRQELDTILNTTLGSVVSPSASVSLEPAVAESPEPATATPDPELTGENPKEVIQ